MTPFGSALFYTAAKLMDLQPQAIGPTLKVSWYFSASFRLHWLCWTTDSLTTDNWKIAKSTGNNLSADLYKSSKAIQQLQGLSYN